ncbi:RodZ family helix-turn-helix domain-containing protein [Nostoc sp. TCL26-01]|uniref:helix-turn-helix domain-containing protein n=1 Tax=Nostoc sp. TCL26-01 TaxID=2576904 RepID=UPI0015BA6DEA|nr:RodZ family helix-turn-helix domain-containing protein [Nostoc sp. TCL26-01]QLE57926.1 helix-turn-helix domain-containing protein [Nostoc sp. TCL26-01]
MNLLNEAQQQQLKEISKYLVQVRQEQSIRIEEVAAKTHIRLYFLQALDAGKFAELPEPVYIQGFIRRYADILGLDGQALANSFTVNPPPIESPNNPPKSESKPNIRIPLFIPYLGLLAVAAIALIYILNPKLISQSLAKKQASTVTKTQQTKPPAKKPNSVVTNPQPATPSPIATSLTNSQTVTPSPTANGNLAVTLELQGKSWLQVKADGKTEFIGELSKGERRTWTAKKQLTVRSGNAGAVLVSVNEQPAKPLGINGVVKEVTYTPEVISQ